METKNLLVRRPEGLYCPLGDFYIDPSRGVKRAVITHGHADHARQGSLGYLCHTASVPILKTRLGSGIFQGVPYGESVKVGDVTVTLYPAGHIVGSAQVLVAYRGQRWVVSGDYKLENDGLATPFVPVNCQVFISECTFGLPVFQWQPQEVVIAELLAWWQHNANLGVASFVHTYSLGKAQRLIFLLSHSEVGTILAHSTIIQMSECVRQLVPELPSVRSLDDIMLPSEYGKSLILIPPHVVDRQLFNRLGLAGEEQTSFAAASGWMRVSKLARQRGVDRGFVLSDHADWPALIRATGETGCDRVYFAHGESSAIVRLLNESGRAAFDLSELGQ